MFMRGRVVALFILMYAQGLRALNIWQVSGAIRLNCLSTLA